MPLQRHDPEQLAEVEEISEMYLRGNDVSLRAVESKMWLQEVVDHGFFGFGAISVFVMLLRR